MLSVLIRCFLFQAVAAKLDLPEDLIGYFSLFLIREAVDGGVTCESVLMVFFFPPQTESLANF